MKLLGWDERLDDWRLACVDLAYRALEQGLCIDFLVDAWAEQLLQPRIEPGLPAMRFAWQTGPARLLSSQQGQQSLLRQLFEHYLPQDTRHGIAERELLRQPDAQIHLKVDHYMLLGRYRLCAKAAGARPDFLIIGAPRAATNSLHHSLAQHPHLCLSLSTEIDFFSENYAQGLEWYLDHLWFEAGKLSYETSATYLYDKLAPERIHALNPQIKLIAVLREPVSRAYSAWNQRQSLPIAHPAHEARSFTQVVSETLAGDLRGGYFERGKYAEQLSRYRAHFSSSQMLLLNFDDLVQDLPAVLRECCRFLEIADFEVNQSLVNQFKGSYAVPLPPELAQQMQTWFEPYNHQLRTQFGLNFAWLNQGS